MMCLLSVFVNIVCPTQASESEWIEASDNDDEDDDEDDSENEEGDDEDDSEESGDEDGDVEVFRLSTES